MKKPKKSFRKDRKVKVVQCFRMVRIEQLHSKDSARAVSEKRKFRRTWEERRSGLSPVTDP